MSAENEEGGLSVGYSSEDRQRQDKNTQALRQLNENMKSFNNALKPLHEFHRTADTFRKNAELLGLNNREINRMTKRMEKMADALHKNDAQKFVDDVYKNMPKEITKGIKGSLSQAMTKIGDKLYTLFQPMIKFASGISAKIKGLGVGIAAAIAAAIGLSFGRVIESSPLRQAVLKIMNTSLTLILRPIGDLVGSVLRPLALYFLKDVAIPFFRAFTPMGKDFSGISRSLGALLLNPIGVITAGIIKGMQALGLGGIVTPENQMKADLQFKDPARLFRQQMGIGEFTHGGSLIPKRNELMGMGIENSQTFKQSGMGFDEFIQAELEKDPTATSLYELGSWQKLAKLRKDLTESGFGYMVNPQQIPAGSGTSPSGQQPQVVTQGGGGIFLPEVLAEEEEVREDNIDAISILGDTVISDGEQHNDNMNDLYNEQEDIWSTIISGYEWFAGGVDETAKNINSSLEWLYGGIEEAWKGLGDWNIVQEAYAEEMDSANDQLVHDVNKLDRVLDKGTFDIGKSIWDGLNWMGETISNGIFGFGESIESGITWLSELIHGSGTEINNTLSGLNYSFATAEEAILTAANLATGQLFNPNASSNPGGTFSVGSDASGMNYSYTSKVMSDQAAHEAALASTGGQPLGDAAGNRSNFRRGKTNTSTVPKTI